MKRLLIEIILIIIFVSGVAMLYNALSGNPLPLIREQKKFYEVDTELLFDKKYETKEKDLEKSISFQQMQELSKNPDVIIIDARTEENYSKGHIGNSVNIYPYAEEQKMMEAIFSMPQDKPIIVYCDGGTCDLSHILCNNLLALGFKRVFLYAGGWEEWEKKVKIKNAK